MEREVNKVSRGEEKKRSEGEKRKKEQGRMSPMAATHHSQLNDAGFFSLTLPLLFVEGGGELGPRPIKRGHGEFTTSRWDCPPLGLVCSRSQEE